MAGKVGEPGINASYLNVSTFTVAGDQTKNFTVGRRVWAYGNSDWYGTVLSSIFTSVTTVTLSATSDNLDSSLTGVYFGITNGNEAISSNPIHDHDGDEGSGGKVDHNDLDNNGSNTHTQIDSHIANTTTNPHSVTKTNIGLGNVVNTDFTSAVSSNTSHRNITTGNPHSITKSDVGLSDVPNTDFTSAVGLNTAKVTNATHTGEVTGDTALTIADNIIDEANLKLDEEPTNEHVLTADSTKTGGMKWAATAAGFSNPMTARGDIIFRNASNLTTRLPIGTNGQVITSNGADISWVNPSSGFADPMTTRGDIIYKNSSNVTARLPVGTTGQILKTDGTNVAWDNGGEGANLSEGTVTETTSNINSDTGSNVTLVSASTTRAGLLTKTKFDEIVANTAKVSNATHTGEVTGSTALTVADNIIDEANLKLDTAPTNDYILTADSTKTGGMKWAANAGGLTDPMTTSGDIIYKNSSNVTTRLPVGTNGMVLKSDSGNISWGWSSGSITNLSEGTATETTVDINSSNGSAATLASASTTRAGLLTKEKFDEITANTAKPTGLADPMTTRGDIIYKNSSGTTTRLPVGTTGQVLKTDGVDISWGSNPAGFTDPTTTRGDLIYKNSSGTTTRLPVGTTGQVLKTDGVDISWENSVGFSNPMTTIGDLIYNYGGVTTRLPIGTVGQVLTSDGTNISWDDVAAGGISNVVEDTTPQLGGDLDLNEKYIQLEPSPSADVTGSGDMASMTVDVNAVGVGAALYMASDGNYEEADANAATTLPCMALALETSTGTKKVLLKGFMRNDSWNWTSIGQPVYVSTTQGTLTQTAPSTTGEFVQRIGIATHADRIFFNPDYTVIEVA